MLQEIDQVLISLVIGHHVGIATITLPLSLAAHDMGPVLGLLTLKILDLLLQPLDDLLAEVTSLGQFLFNLLVDLDVSLHRVNLSLHLAVLIK